MFLDRKFYSNVGVAVSADTQEPAQVGSSVTYLSTTERLFSQNSKTDAEIQKSCNRME